VVEEEGEEGAVDRDGDRAAGGNRGPVVHGNRIDGNKSATSRTGRMTMTATMTATGGIGIVPHKVSLIIATMARLIATDPTVAAKCRMAVAAAAGAEAAGAATEKNGEEEIQRQRRTYTYDGGFCFKARLISIEYV
jgi:hypothetical protein